VPFLNVKPLVFPLEAGLLEHDFEVIYTPPSSLAHMLFEGKIDLGLIPVAELLRRQSYRVVSNISISSSGKVDSVILLAKSGIRDLRTIAVDARSRSSTALLRVILEVFHKLSPVYISREPNERFLAGVDGGMVIGNAGLKLRYFPPKGYKVFDLGEMWTYETGLPFVYAVYAVHKDAHLGNNLQVLEAAKSMGLKLVRKIAKMESGNMGLSEEICLRYLTERIRYDLGETEIKGIVAYSQFLSGLDEVKEIKELQIYSE
jgi:chorismate dehydratase